MDVHDVHRLQRHRVLIGRNVRGFWEYLFVYSNTKFFLPTEVPSRFLNRILTQESKIPFFHVDSRFDSTPQRLTKDHLSKSQVWVMKDDLELKGAFQTLQGQRTFFGVPIDDDDALFVLANIVELKHTASPNVFYHGTAESHLNLILAEGLRPSMHGMLGAGYYVGTFWKAARFAVRSQAYELQKGVVFRVLATIEKAIEFPRSKWACACTQCIHNPFSNIADHRGAWTKEGDAAVARATGEPCGLCRDGTPRYALRNEEWCLLAKPLILQWASISSCGFAHDPLDRSVIID